MKYIHLPQLYPFPALQQTKQNLETDIRDEKNLKTTTVVPPHLCSKTRNHGEYQTLYKLFFPYTPMIKLTL